MKYFLIVCCILCVLKLYGQDAESEFQTLFSKVENNGGYGAFSVNYSQVKVSQGKVYDAIVLGGKGEWIANHCFGLGFGGFGIISGNFTNEILSKKVMMNAGYGGLIAEGIFFPKKMIHFTIPLLIGAGGATLLESYNEPHSYNDNFANYSLDQDQFFIIEPGIELEVNIVKFLRISFGAYYRVTSGINLIGVEKRVLDGFSGGVTFKLGSF